MRVDRSHVVHNQSYRRSDRRGNQLRRRWMRTWIAWKSNPKLSAWGFGPVVAVVMIGLVTTIFMAAQETPADSDNSSTVEKLDTSESGESLDNDEDESESEGGNGETGNGEVVSGLENDLSNPGIADETTGNSLLPDVDLSAGTGAEVDATRESLAVLDPPLEENPVPLNDDERKASYKLGVGDIIGVRYHGRDEFDRPEIRIAPDGTISYLEAKQVKVAGLTVPQIRSELEKRVGEFRQLKPRLIIYVRQLASERFTILGMVKGNGLHVLDRRIRLLEALALSGGVMIGSENALPTIAADFRRSFLVRDGTKMDVDFEKLYVQGDLSQNVSIKNGDYIYIASNAQNRCYVLGSVRSNRAVAVGAGATVMSVLTSAGGYSDDAWKAKVLLIRGSLSAPEVTVVDTADILKGTAVDVEIEAGDIIYVHNRPFRTATRLLDVAIKALIRGAIAGAIDDQVGIGI